MKLKGVDLMTRSFVGSDGMQSFSHIVIPNQYACHITNTRRRDDDDNGGGGPK